MYNAFFCSIASYLIRGTESNQRYASLVLWAGSPIVWC